MARVTHPNVVAVFCSRHDYVAALALVRLGTSSAKLSARSDEARTALKTGDTFVALGSPRGRWPSSKARGAVEQAGRRRRRRGLDRALAALRAGHLLDDPRAEEQYSRGSCSARGCFAARVGRPTRRRAARSALAAARAATPPLDVEIAGAWDDLGRARLATDDPGAAHALHAEAAERVLHALGDGSHSTGPSSRTSGLTSCGSAADEAARPTAAPPRFPARPRGDAPGRRSRDDRRRRRHAARRRPPRRRPEALCRAPTTP